MPAWPSRRGSPSASRLGALAAAADDDSTIGHHVSAEPGSAVEDADCVLGRGPVPSPSPGERPHPVGLEPSPPRTAAGVAPQPHQKPLSEGINGKALRRRTPQSFEAPAPAAEDSLMGLPKEAGESSNGLRGRRVACEVAAGDKGGLAVGISLRPSSLERACAASSMSMHGRSTVTFRLVLVGSSDSGGSPQ